MKNFDTTLQSCLKFPSTQVKSEWFPNFASEITVLKILVKKKYLLLSKILICCERNFHQELALKFQDEFWSHFPFLQIAFKICFWYVKVCTHWLGHVDEVIKWHLIKGFFAASFNLLAFPDHTHPPKDCLRGSLITKELVTIIWSLKRSICQELVFLGSFQVYSKL